MSKKGWISIHRSLQDHWLWQEKKVFSKLEAWIDVLLTVNHTEQKTVIKNTLFTIKRGQSINSLDTWASRWKWNKSKVRRFFSLLEKENMIELKNETKTTRLTVCKYDSYQDLRNANETQTKRKRNADETQMTPNNNVNNNNNINNENKDEENTPAKKVNTFSTPVLNCLDNCLNYFPEHLKPKNKNSCLETIEKLERIDKIPFNVIEEIVKKTRNDPFWSKNFLTLNKLRKKNKEGIMYISVFAENIKSNKNLKPLQNEQFRNKISEIRRNNPSL